MTQETKNQGSLFSGVGGWSVASDEMGWKTAFCCEWDENKQYELKYHWPNAEIYGDITNTDFTVWRNRIDILTASTPCQPFSFAGKREGSSDVRHLWPETHRAIREIQPRWFVLENVPGLVNWSKGMVFKQIIADLENEGYEVLPFLLPACGVNAPHKRERIWIVAHSDRNINSRKESGSLTETGEIPEQHRTEDGSSGELSGAGKVNGRGIIGNGYENTAYSTNPGIKSLQQQENRANKPSITPDTNKEGYKRDKLGRTFEQGRIKPGREHQGQSFESITKLHKTTNWLNFPTVSPLRIGDDGFSRDSLRSFINENSGGLLTEKEVNQIIQKSLNKWNNETIAAGGDAVVPEVVLQIFKAIDQYDKLYK